ncbi:BadF/BadG/BcrA/BcrD ATPase family protein [Bergeyella sp. RCAD1439]|uniref:BadF/BadG/BcrA/BcrD ATPase family protein n=1 Tax=Bergeyella anatis TaxID=3113737 RepID=UPI002E16F166|nr:BadF/BadG/BcrA/BcrD ATPase family protein [Bergeyella sp. RCAD1439]
MIAIIDGGSTKCDWVILESDGTAKCQISTLGFNPNTADLNLVHDEIEKNAALEPLKNHITRLFYYGTGCGTLANVQKVEELFRKIFPHAEILVKEDLTAAAYAAYNGQPAIVCILGTGSNACFFDGKTVRRDLPSLGFLIGDEGSGNALGKALLKRFFMKKLPSDLELAFQEAYALTIDEALKNMYHNPRANAYLGEFNKFVAEHKSHPYFQHMVFEEMKNFFNFQVLPYPEAHTAEINFIGFVAYLYEDVLRAAAADLNLRVGRIVKKPIDSLVDYHKKYIL